VAYSLFTPGLGHMSAVTTHSADNGDSRSDLPPSAGRSRIVTFRVSSGEFAALARASHAAGSRSLSAFARAAALDKVTTMQAPCVTLSGDLTTLTKGLAQLDAALQDTSKRIRRVLGPADGSAGDEPSETGRT
jgi:hypothetical protein